MAPVQLNRWMYQPAVAPAQASAPTPTAAPAAPAPPSTVPQPVYRAPTPGLATRRTPRPAVPTPDTTYPQGTTPGRASRRANRRATAQVRTARVRTAMPTRVADAVPALRATTPAEPGGATMAAPPPPPTLQQGRARQRRTRPPAQRPPRPPGQGGPQPIPFEPLAIGAFVVTFFAPLFGLLLAIASLRRAATSGVSPVLSWIALLVSGVATLFSLGLVAAIVDAIQSTGL